MNDAKERPLPFEALQKALVENEALQEQVLAELKRIGGLKAQNRKQAAALSLVHASSLAKNQEKAPTLPYCRWSDKYFVDKNRRSEPRPNEDAARREQAESASFFAQTNPPWTTHGNKLLERAIAETKQESPGCESIDFERVAEKVSTKNLVRSAEECRVQSRNLIKKAGWQQPEIEKLRRIVSELQEKSHDHSKIDFVFVAKTLGTGRSAWEVFRIYQARIIGKPKPIRWAPEEDEFLLKFVAAMGPQLVINSECASFLAARHLSDKTKREIKQRLNATLLNPKFVCEAWNEVDERKLALCMKVYSESDPKHALFLSTGHIPTRSRTISALKWDRNLDPSFSAAPFSKREDQELLQKLRENPGMGWTEFQQNFFPHRHHHRLSNRFSELAEDQDILDRYGDKVLKRSSDGDCGQMESVSSVGADFVVKVKKRTRMS